MLYFNARLECVMSVCLSALVCFSWGGKEGGVWIVLYDRIFQICVVKRGF